MKTSKHLKSKIALLLGSVTFSILMAEIGLRFANIEYPPPQRMGEVMDPEPIYNLRDPYRGWGGNPNTVAYWTGEGEHGEIRMNSAGFRDRERTVEKPENGFRVALLGDSFVEALYLRAENTYAAHVEKALQQCPAFQDREVEVLNFGVQGYSTAQELMTLRHHVWQYSPDLVVLNFYAGNDLRNNYRPLEHDHLRPYFVLEDGELVADLSFRELKHWQRDRYAFSVVDLFPVKVVRSSRILQLIRNVNIQRNREKQAVEYEQINVGFYREPEPDSDWEEAWRVTEALIKTMRDEVNENHAEFLLVTVSDSYQVLPGDTQRNWFINHYNFTDLFYPDRRLASLGQEEGFPVYNLAYPLWEAVKKSGQCLHGFDNAVPCGGHWNPEGSRIAGGLLAAYLCERITPSATKDE